MLTLILGTDWTLNRKWIMDKLAQNVAVGNGGRILIVPELISHESERRLSAAAGDTSSRFVQVLSFTRLARRVAEELHLQTEECLDEGGRVVAMAAAARQLHSKLKAYASVETKPEFLTGLVEAVDEFKRCCVTAEDLKDASRQSAGAFAQKLEELALLLETYDGLCRQGKRDPREQMTWLLEKLEDWDFASRHTFYIDGFPDFTRQHLAIVEHLICNAPNVTVSLNCDVPGSSKAAFEAAGETAAHLLRFAKEEDIPVECITVPQAAGSVQQITSGLFQGTISPVNSNNTVLTAYRCQTVYEESLACAGKVLELIRDGARYRDISVVCADMTPYRNVLHSVFKRCNIPAYQAGTEEILEKTVIATVLSAIDAVLGGFDQKDVLRYLKSALSPLTPAQCDRVENYCILWGVRGSRWKEDWQLHPDGLGLEWTEEAHSTLEALNRDRRLAIEPLADLQEGIRSSKNLAEQIEALYCFLEETELPQRLSKLAQQMDASGDNRSAQILNQLWEILLTALEQMHDVLGKTIWEPETFARLFKLLLSQYDVGTIPPVLDAVTVGSLSAMRCQKEKHLIVLGCLEGNLPGYSGVSGVLTEQERSALRQLGVPLNGGALNGLRSAFTDIYGVFCGAQETVTVSCPAGQPSYIYKRLVKMAGGEKIPDISLVIPAANRQEAASLVVRLGSSGDAESLLLTDTCKELENSTRHALGKIGGAQVQSLYGRQLVLSATQIDTQANCRFHYFLRYGLRAKERKEATVDPAEFGTYVHWVLEQIGREITQQGGFREVSLEDTLELARSYSERYYKERFSQLETDRLSYLFRRNTQELNMIVRELWEELQDSSFQPVAYELFFGRGGEMPPVNVHGTYMDAVLSGHVDRVDTWRQDGSTYFRVVDYKTGVKDFDYCDVYNGLGLQMLLYLFALEEKGEVLLGKARIPAGVQYFPARVPVVTADGSLSEEEAEAERRKAWKRSGLVLKDEQVIDAFEGNSTELRGSYKRKKDGTLDGDLADRQQLRMLMGFVFSLVGKMVDDISSGCVEANPYTRGSKHNACTYCPYGTVCNEQSELGRRNYKAVKPADFWQDVEKEGNAHG